MQQADLSPALNSICNSIITSPARSLHELRLKLSVAAASVVVSLGPDDPTSRLLGALLDDANRIVESQGGEEAANLEQQPTASAASA